MADRFYVDERVGCIAVREEVDYLTPGGLRPEYPDVVAFWSGDSKGQYNWGIHKWQREKAKALCDTLNGYCEWPRSKK